MGIWQQANVQISVGSKHRAWAFPMPVMTYEGFQCNAGAVPECFSH